MKLDVFHHKRGEDSIESIKKQVFLCDERKEVKQEPKRGRKPAEPAPCLAMEHVLASSAFGRSSHATSLEVWTIRNFGSTLDLSASKSTDKLEIGWRCRPLDFSLHETNSVAITRDLIRIDANNSEGVKTITPIRPIACLSGSLTLPQGDQVIRMF